MTPIGTRTRPTCIPFGLVHIFGMSPSGSGSAATSRRPAAISTILSAVRRNRSAIAFFSGAVPKASRSSSFAASSASFCSSSASAIARRARFFTAVESVASRPAACLARVTNSLTYSGIGMGATIFHARRFDGFDSTLPSLVTSVRQHNKDSYLKTEYSGSFNAVKTAIVGRFPSIWT